MIIRTMLLACLAPAVAASLLAGCAEQTPIKRLVPVTDMVAAGGPGNGEGWTAVGSVETRPALSLYKGGRPMLVLTCTVLQTTVQARGFEPKQAWPQPDLTIRFGEASRTQSPDVRNMGDQVAYEVAFGIADDVLDAIGSGAPITVEFNGQTRTEPSIPGDQARLFAERCGSLVPAGMRRNNRPRS